MNRTEEIEAARSVHVVEVAERLGLEPVRGDKFACVSCASSDALSIKPDKARAKCFSCGDHWDGIGLVQAVKGCSFSQAYRWLVGQDVEFQLTSEPDNAQGIDVRQQIWDAFSSNKPRHPLGAGLSTNAIAYLEGRAITCHDYTISARKEYWRGLTKRFSRGELNAAGLITSKDKLHLGWIDEMLLFGYFDASGHLETFRARGLKHKRGPKVWSLCGNQATHPFGWPDQLDGEGPLYIVEGELDAMSLWTLGRDAIGVPGANGWKAEWAKLVSDREVVIIRDDDDAGERMALDIINSGVRANSCVLDTANDPNDALQQNTLKDELEEIECRNSTTWRSC